VLLVVLGGSCALEWACQRYKSIKSCPLPQELYYSYINTYNKHKKLNPPYARTYIMQVNELIKCHN